MGYRIKAKGIRSQGIDACIIILSTFFTLSKLPFFFGLLCITKKLFTFCTIIEKGGTKGDTLRAMALGTYF